MFVLPGVLVVYGIALAFVYLYMDSTTLVGGAAFSGDQGGVKEDVRYAVNKRHNYEVVTLHNAEFRVPTLDRISNKAINHANGIGRPISKCRSPQCSPPPAEPHAKRTHIPNTA